MSRTGISLVFAAALPIALVAPTAWAQTVDESTLQAGDAFDQGGAAEAMPADYAEPAYSDDGGSAPPIPPYVDTPPVAAQGGGYCFDGPHPVDSRVEPGVTWDSTSGRHVHAYPPFDLRLFNFQNGCYYFIGDPTDFGYAGNTYSYYGAHPILGGYGGGWCFMIGPHHHFWAPWSPLFVTVGPWFYWEGPYDPFFWTYWPFYHYYYRHHYPSYYARGAFFHRHAVAPRITSVPRPMGRMGAAWQGAGRGLRAPGAMPRTNAPAAGGFRPGRSAPGGALPRTNGGFAPRSVSPAVPGRGFTPRSFSAPGGGFTPRGFSAPSRPSGGFGRGGGGFGRGGGGFGRGGGLRR